jgi:sulfur carrier protein ThiS
MKVLYINNDGGGFADYIEVQEQTTVKDLFEDRIGGAPESYLIRVNRQPVGSDYVLQEGDRVSFTPTKIEGARVQVLGKGDDGGHGDSDPPVSPRRDQS